MKVTDDSYQDQQRIASLCSLFLIGAFTGKASFAEAVIGVAGSWDLFSRTVLYGRTERTVEQHFCAFWDECTEGNCQYEKDSNSYLREMHSYVPLQTELIVPEKRGMRLRFAVLKRDGYRCQICGHSQNDSVKLEVDHKWPKSKQGEDTWENLWTLCFDCNRGKHTDLL